MNSCIPLFLTSWLILGCLLSTAAPAQDINPAQGELRPSSKIYSPYVERTATDKNFAEGLYWGDTHLHTSYSTDAGMVGNKLSPEKAYRFARGEEVRTSTGQRARIIRPLDFLVVADHAENLGLAPMIAESNPELLRTKWGQKFHLLVRADEGYEAFRLWGSEGVAKNKDLIGSPKIQRTVWDRQIEAAERFNEPGRFTAFIGFEWTSINNMKNPSNLHRVVLFQDGADKAKQVLPFSPFDSPDPEKLWDYMAAYEAKTGGSVLAIPHNGNLSNGLMFAVERLNGQPIDKQYAQSRMRWEPLIEVTKSRVMARHTPSFHRQMSLPTTGPGIKATLPGSKPKKIRCCPMSTPVRLCRLGFNSSTSWEPILSSSG